MGLPSAHRLKRRRDFDAVFRTGRKEVHKRLILWTLARPDRGASRLGLSVSRRVGNAVVRNRVKRVLRAAWAESSPQPMDAVLLARPGREPRSLDEARRAVRELLDRAARPAPPRSGSRGARRDTSRRGPRVKKHSARRSPDANPATDAKPGGDS